MGSTEKTQEMKPLLAAREEAEVPRGARSKTWKRDLRGARGLGNSGFLQTSSAWGEWLGRGHVDRGFGMEWALKDS